MSVESNDPKPVIESEQEPAAEKKLEPSEEDEHDDEYYLELERSLNSPPFTDLQLQDIQLERSLDTLPLTELHAQITKRKTPSSSASEEGPLVERKLRYDPGNCKLQATILGEEQDDEIDPREAFKKYRPEDFKQQEIVAEERDEQEQDNDIDEAYKNTDIEHALGDVWYVTGASDNSVEEDLDHIKSQVLGSNRTRLFTKIKEKLSSEKWTWIKPRLSFAPMKGIDDWTDDSRIDSTRFRTRALLGYTSPPWQEEPLVGGVYYCFPPLGTVCGQNYFFVQPCYIVMRKGVRTIVRNEADVDKILPVSLSSSC